MATVQLFSQFPCKRTLAPSSPSTSKLHSKSPSLLSINRTNRRSEIGTSVHWPEFRIRAIGATEDSSSDSSAKVESSTTSVAEQAAKDAIGSVEETEKLKRLLVDTLYGTDRGLNASSETRGEISELITQLELKNPTPAPNDALFLLNGKWILAYTSFVGLFPLLSRRIEPLVKVDEISQTVDFEGFTVQNSIRFAGPLATTSFSTDAKFEIRSPRRVQIKFEQGVIGTPQLTDSIEIPEFVEVFGQKIDLNPIKGILTSIQDTASSVARTISSQPPLKFSLPAEKTQSWLLCTYLDKDLRISRGDAGSVYVLFKEGSSLLNP